MIEKFISIKNVGRFRACTAAGDVTLRPVTLVYAENARGKTTLCDILRSLRSGDGDYVRGRATLGRASTAKTPVASFAPASFSADEYVALPDDPGIDAKIAATEARLSAAPDSEVHVPEREPDTENECGDLRPCEPPSGASDQ